ncbi:MAG TPA: DVUA0089 family protein [Candidatus Acidoferrales bacterium]
MNTIKSLLLTALLAFAAGSALADTTQSYTGMLSSPDNATGTFDATDSFAVTLVLTGTSDVTLQTYGFGGGTNAAGTLIAPGGTDPFVGLFSGTGDPAVYINGSSLDLTNYSPGCLPAGMASNFGDTTCGDVTFTFDDLAAGTYTVLVSDGQYIPGAAVGIGTTLGDGAFDLTRRVFCNLVDVGTSTPCPNTSGAYALDITESGPMIQAPEPATLLLLGTGLAATFGVRRRLA